MVFRDTPSRREISRIGTCSRLCHRRMMLKNAMSNTPLAPAWSRQGSVQTWVKSQWKNPTSPGQFSVEINTFADYYDPKSCKVTQDPVRVWDPVNCENN